MPHATSEKKHDPVNHPKHYTNHPSGIECIQITRHMGFNVGNAIKYLWRSDLKNGLEDLKKAVWYIQDEIKKRESYSYPPPIKNACVACGHPEGAVMVHTCKGEK